MKPVPPSFNQRDVCLSLGANTHGSNEHDGARGYVGVRRFRATASAAHDDSEAGLGIRGAPESDLKHAGMREALLATVDARLGRPLDISSVSEAKPSSSGRAAVLRMGPMKHFEPPIGSEFDGDTTASRKARDLFYVDGAFPPTGGADVCGGIAPFPDGVCPTAGPVQSVNSIVLALNTLLGCVQSVLLHASAAEQFFDTIATHCSAIDAITSASLSACSLGSEEPGCVCMDSGKRSVSVVSIPKNADVLLRVRDLARAASSEAQRFSKSSLEHIRDAVSGVLRSSDELRERITHVKISVDSKASPTVATNVSLKQELLRAGVENAVMRDQLIRYRVTSRFRQNAREKREARFAAAEGRGGRHTAVQSLIKPEFFASHTNPADAGISNFHILARQLVVCISAEDVLLAYDSLGRRQSVSVLDIFCDAIELLLRPECGASEAANEMPIAQGPAILFLDRSAGRYLIAFHCPDAALKFSIMLQYVLLEAPWPSEALEFLLPGGSAPFSVVLQSDVTNSSRSSQDYLRYVQEHAHEAEHNETSAHNASLHHSSVVAASRRVVHQLFSRHAPAFSRSNAVLNGFNAKDSIVSPHALAFRGCRAKIGITLGDLSIERSPNGATDSARCTIIGVHGNALTCASALSAFARGGDIVVSGQAKAFMWEACPGMARAMFCAPLPCGELVVEGPVYSVMPLGLLGRCYHFSEESSQSYRRRVSLTNSNVLWFRGRAPGVNAASQRSTMGLKSDVDGACLLPQSLFSQWGNFVERSLPFAMGDYLRRVSLPMSVSEEAQAALYAATAMHALALTSNRRVVSLQKKIIAAESQQRAQAIRAMSECDMSPLEVCAVMLTRYPEVGKWDNVLRDEIAKGMPSSFVYEGLESPMSKIVAHFFSLWETKPNCGALNHSYSHAYVAFFGYVRTVFEASIESKAHLPPLFASLHIIDLIERGLFSEAHAFSRTLIGRRGSSTDGADGPYGRALAAATLAAAVAISSRSHAVHWCSWNAFVFLSSGVSTELLASLVIDPEHVLSTLAASRHIMPTREGNKLHSTNCDADSPTLAAIVLYFALREDSQPTQSVAGLCTEGKAVDSGSVSLLHAPTAPASLVLFPQHRRALIGASLPLFERKGCLPGETLKSSIISIQHTEYTEGNFMLCSLEDGIGQLMDGEGDSAISSGSFHEWVRQRLDSIESLYRRQYALAPYYLIPVLDIGTSSKYFRSEFNNVVGMPSLLQTHSNRSRSLSALTTGIQGGEFQRRLLHIVSPLGVPFSSLKCLVRPFTTVQQWGKQLSTTLARLHFAGYSIGVVSTQHSLFFESSGDTSNLLLLQAAASHFIGSLGSLDWREDTGSPQSRRVSSVGASVRCMKDLIELLPPEFIMTASHAKQIASSRRHASGRSSSPFYDDRGAVLPFLTPPSEALGSFARELQRSLSLGASQSKHMQVHVEGGTCMLASDTWQYSTALFEIATGSRLWDVLRMTKRFSGAAQNYTVSADAHEDSPKRDRRLLSCDTDETNAGVMAYLERHYGIILRESDGLNASPIFASLSAACRALRIAVQTAGGVAAKVFDPSILWPDAEGDGERILTPVAEEMVVSFVLLADLFRLVLQVDPAHRPSMHDISNHPFFWNVPHSPASSSPPLFSRPTYLSNGEEKRPAGLAFDGLLRGTQDGLLPQSGRLFQVLPHRSCLCVLPRDVPCLPSEYGASLVNVAECGLHRRRRAAAARMVRVEMAEGCTTSGISEVFTPAALRFILGNTCIDAPMEAK